MGGMLKKEENFLKEKELLFCRYYYILHIKAEGLTTFSTLQKKNFLSASNEQYNEYKILRKIYHPFIFQLKGINYTDDKYLYFLLEYVQGGEFSLYLTNSG